MILVKLGEDILQCALMAIHLNLCYDDTFKLGNGVTVADPSHKHVHKCLGIAIECSEF